MMSDISTLYTGIGTQELASNYLDLLIKVVATPPEATTVMAPAPFKDREGERWVHATNAEACNPAAEPLH